jgi:hypothetical protein
MIRTPRIRPSRISTLVLGVLLATGCLLQPTLAGAHGSTTTGQKLVGLFRLTGGTAKGTQISGTWFRMLQPGANAKTGPFMINANSPVDGGQVALLQPGTSGGLRTDGYQSEPTPAFNSGGDSLADAITKPASFFGVNFSISTNQVDPQTQADVAPPTITLKNGKLTANLSAWSASWNNQNFNQGAPKPVPNTSAKAPGQAKAQKVWDWVSGKFLNAAPAATVSGTDATGTYNAKTHAFALEWTSHIQGGPFNGFTGQWHLQGTFKPGKNAP